MITIYTHKNNFCNFLEVVTFVVQNIHILLSEQFNFYSKSLKDKAREGFRNLSLAYCFAICLFCSARRFCNLFKTFQEMQNKKREKKTPTMESKIDAVYSAQWPRTDVSEDNPVLIISPPIINFQLPRIGITYDKPAIPAIKIGSTDMVYQLLLANWDTDLLWVQEQFCALFLNNANEVIGFKIFCTGALSSTHTDPSLILAVAIVSRAAKIIVAHNHPSGDNRASVGDIKVTRDLYVASKMLNIQLLDHIILARDGYTSLCNEGVIDNCLPSQSLAK